VNTVLKPFTVANGEAVCVFVADWVEEPIPGGFAVQFDPPLSFPTDLASCRPPSDSAEALVEAALRVRDAERASEGSIPPLTWNDCSSNG
jgi:hypothetical protein